MRTKACEPEQTFDEGVSVLRSKLWPGGLCCQQAGSTLDVKKKLSKRFSCGLIVDGCDRLMDEQQMRLGQIRLVQFSVEDLVDRLAWLSLFVFLSVKPLFDFILCSKVTFPAAIPPVLVGANAEAVLSAPGRVLLDRIQAEGFEVRLKFRITCQTLGG